jgi:uncharacterized membrane protein
MYSFLVTLHVVSAVLLIGPFALAAFAGRRALRRRDADETRAAAVWMARFAVGSILVVLLGFAALGLSHRWAFGTPWVVISVTVYVITIAVATGYTVPALRKAARLLPHSLAGGDVAADPEVRGQLTAVSGRIAGSGAIVLLGVLVITVLMVVRPFGR